MFYFSNNQRALNFIADYKLSSGADTCTNNLLSDSSKIKRFQITLPNYASSNFISALTVPFFLNKELYLVTYQKNTVTSTITDSYIWKLTLSVSSSGVVSSSWTQVTSLTNQIVT